MNGFAVTNRPSSIATDTSRRALIATSYAVLGSILCWSRLVGLGAGYCCDEIRTVTEYVRGGPGAILSGPYIPNNHELFSLLGWATSSVVGESEIGLRLWSAIPFLLGVVVVTVWLHGRVNPMSGILFLFLTTFSPLLLDLSRLARGYGLAFLAMSVLVTAALEAERSGRTTAVCSFMAGGLVGSLTLPHFSLAFVATAAALLARRDLRVRVLAGTGLSIVAIVAFYAPHLDDIAESTSSDYGQQIETLWIVTAPTDQVLVPAVTLIDDAFTRPSFASLPWAVAFALLIYSSPLLRQRRPALILCAGVVTTLVAFWATGTHVVPRFLSFLLVPLFVLVASGIASIFARVRERPLALRTVVALVTIGFIAITAAPLIRDAPRRPRESTREAANVIRKLVPVTTPVFAYVPYPHDLEFHLGREVQRFQSPREVPAVCRSESTSVLVEQDYLLPAVVIPCTGRNGTRHYRFVQLARGGHIDVWILPPASA